MQQTASMETCPDQDIHNNMVVCPFCHTRSILRLPDAEPGDLAACQGCTGVSIFGDNMVPRPPLTKEEVQRVEYAVSNSLWGMLAAGRPRS